MRARSRISPWFSGLAVLAMFFFLNGCLTLNVHFTADQKFAENGNSNLTVVYWEHIQVPFNGMLNQSDTVASFASLKYVGSKMWAEDICRAVKTGTCMPTKDGKIRWVVSLHPGEWYDFSEKWIG